MRDHQIKRDEFTPKLVSTVITSYNKGQFLGEAIESALCQEYALQEIIIVDDGSTDDTRRVAAEFGGRIRYIYQENRGQSSAKNRGIQESRGEFVAFLDGDDRWRLGKLRKQIPLFDGRPELGVVYGHIASFSDRSPAVQPVLWAPGMPFQRGNILDSILVHNFVPFSTTVVRRLAFERCGQFDEQCWIAPDYDLFLRIARQFAFDYLDEILVDYWVGENRIGTDLGTKFEHVMRIQENFLKNFYPNGFPNRAAVRAATARKHSEHGDWLLAAGSQFEALRAHFSAACIEPWRLQRCRDLIRDMIPNRIVGRLKRGLSKCRTHPANKLGD